MGGLLHDKYDKFFKRKIHNLRFHKLKTWQLILCAIILVFLCATFLRIDHLKMVELRDAVLSADEEGDSEKISAALEELKNFTFSHTVINVVDDNGNQKLTFGTGVFYLENEYRRAAEKALAETESVEVSDENPNGNIYAAAAAVCKPIAIQNGWVWNSAGYIECMTGEIEKYPAADDLVSEYYANIPSTELYRKNYASPLWTPTLFGFTFLALAVVLLILIWRFLVWLILWVALKFL